jgi:hypothetical protein
MSGSAQTSCIFVLYMFRTPKVYESNDADSIATQPGKLEDRAVPIEMLTPFVSNGAALTGIRRAAVRKN